MDQYHQECNLGQNSECESLLDVTTKQTKRKEKIKYLKTGKESIFEHNIKSFL